MSSIQFALDAATHALLTRIAIAAETIATAVEPPVAATSLKFGIPRSITKKGNLMAPGSISFTNDHDERVPLIWADDVGPCHPDTTGTTVTSDNPAVISGGDVAADGTSVVLRSAGDGTCNVTVANGALTDTISVTVGEPIPTSVQLDVSKAAQVAKGEPAG